MRLAPGELRDDLVIEIAAGLSVTGRVVRAGGAGAAARLTAWSQSGGAPADTVSADDGAFRVEGRFPGPYELRAVATDGWRTRRGVKLVDRDLTGVALQLEPEVTLAGLVLDPGGRPVAGARVLAGTEPATLGWVGRTAPATITSADGRFRFEALDAGRVTLRVEKEDVGTASWSGRGLRAGTNHQLVLRLDAGAGLAGRVRLPDGRPAPGAVVYAEYPGQRRTFFDGHGREHVASRAVAGADGAYTLRGLSPGVLRVTASRDGGPLRSRRHVSPTALAAGELKTLDLVVPREQHVSGRVLRPDGRPAAGALVLVHVGDTRPPIGFSRRAVADQDGRFSVRDLDGGELYNVWADQPGFTGGLARAVRAGVESLESPSPLESEGWYRFRPDPRTAPSTRTIRCSW